MIDDELRWSHGCKDLNDSYKNHQAYDLCWFLEDRPNDCNCYSIFIHMWDVESEYTIFLHHSWCKCEDVCIGVHDKTLV